MTSINLNFWINSQFYTNSRFNMMVTEWLGIYWDGSNRALMNRRHCLGCYTYICYQRYSVTCGNLKLCTNYCRANCPHSLRLLELRRFVLPSPSSHLPAIFRWILVTCSFFFLSDLFVPPTTLTVLFFRDMTLPLMLILLEFLETVKCGWFWWEWNDCDYWCGWFLLFRAPLLFLLVLIDSDFGFWSMRPRVHLYSTLRMRIVLFV